ncbi:RNA polymerase sigma factor [Microbacterium soli]|uniref:RNA polymerase sigma factor n=1 Tax=Microbacterium soli TaxID=446075 RepID=A0ABP7MSQ5_9MICO
MREDAYAVAAAAARDGYGRLVAMLASADGDLAAAEDALGDALERALRGWTDQGVPANPAGWLVTVARNRLRDRWKSAEVRRTDPLAAEPGASLSYVEDIDPDAIGDKRMELLFVCAHPAIDPAARAPLMLNTVLGFTAAQIAQAFAIPAATMATRLVRAKRRIRDSRISFEIPDRTQVPGRMASVLEAVYGCYVIEWETGGQEPRPLPSEALRLVEVLAELAPDDPEARGLAALVLFSAARAPARASGDGRFVPLAAQDTSLWDTGLIARAHQHLREAHARRSVGRFQLEAAIQALHCARAAGHDLAWGSLRSLHAELHAIAPSLGSKTALAAVTAETDGPVAGLTMLDDVIAESPRFQPAWATRAHLLSLVGRDDEAIRAYDRAIALTVDPGQRTFLQSRREDRRSSCRSQDEGIPIE